MEPVNEAICGTTMTYDSIWGRNAFSNRRYNKPSICENRGYHLERLRYISVSGCDARRGEKMGNFPYLDLEEDYQDPLMHRVRGRDEVCERAKALRMSQFQVSSTNTHPNLQAHIYESTFVENFLRSL